MVRFSNSKLKQTRYIVNGIAPIFGSTTSIVTPISASLPPPRENVDASRKTSDKANCGLTSTLRDTTDSYDPSVDLGVVYSNGARYSFLDYKSSTPECTIVVPDDVIQVQQVTDDGITYIDVDIGTTVVITAYVGSQVVPQLVPPNNTTCIGPAILKSVFIPPSNNNC
jgi:hypothetical protein